VYVNVPSALTTSVPWAGGVTSSTDSVSPSMSEAPASGSKVTVAPASTSSGGRTASVGASFTGRTVRVTVAVFEVRPSASVKR